MRERKGVALATIADATKIRASLFASFEQNDLRAWPIGLYRRAYFREYARLFDDRVDESCDEFKRLFTDEAESPPAKPGEPQPVRSRVDPAADLRLSLDAQWHGPPTPVGSRLTAALLDAVIVSTVSGAMMLVSGFDAAVTMAAVALAYFSLATVLFGESPSQWMIARRDAIVAAFTGQDEAVADEQAEDQSAPRPWISDATRVGPSPPPQLRVRFKV